MCLRTRYYANSCVHCYGYIIDEPDVTEDEEVDESEEVKLGEIIDESKKDNQPSEGENPTE